VFSTTLYTGNGSPQTFTTGIDLATDGGLLWIKNRSSAIGNCFIDPSTQYYLSSISTDPYTSTLIPTYMTAITTTGFSVGSNNDGGFVGAGFGSLNKNFAAWSFRKKPKFFDLVYYTGTGSATTIAHNLGSVPACIIVKRTDLASDWQVYHSGLTSAAYSIQLNLTNAQASATTVWNSTAPTSSVFSVGTDASVNDSGGTYVAYIFASNSGGFGLSGTDNVISCGSYTGNGSTTGPIVTLGYEPQWLLVKNASSSASWSLIDVMRGFPMSGKNQATLFPDSNVAEVNNTTYQIQPQSTGFQPVSTNAAVNTNGNKYIYIAIRRGPMKVPTTPTSVFIPVARSGSSTAATTNFPVDMAMTANRSSVVSHFATSDRLRGSPAFVYTGNANTEGSSSTIIATTAFQSNTQYRFTGANDTTTNASGVSYINYFFARAPSFMDVVCYTGTGSARTVTHNLGVVPELMIVKSRTTADWWAVYHSALGATQLIWINSTDGAVSDSSSWNNTTPTSSVFTVNNSAETNASGSNYVAYLFATLAGISKVGSYTGAGVGNAQTINCGFTTGARFVFIKNTANGNNWYVYDTQRGMVNGNDRYIYLNGNAAEVTGTNYIFTSSTGFEVTVNAPTGLNDSGATYIYLAIA
jgi:hypothetical protein